MGNVVLLETVPYGSEHTLVIVNVIVRGMGMEQSLFVHCLCVCAWCMGFCVGVFPAQQYHKAT